MMRDGFFRHLLPGDIDTEGLKGMGLRDSGREREQTLIGLPRRRSGIGGKGVFELYGCIPVRTEFSFCSSECLLCGKRGVELHGGLLDYADCSIRAGRNRGQCNACVYFPSCRLCRL